MWGSFLWTFSIGRNVLPISNVSVLPGVKKTFLVGASHMMKVHELFNDAGKFPPMIGDTTIFIGLQNKRLDPSLALKNLQRSEKEGDLVVLDPFCNNVINPIGTNDDSNTRPIKPYTTHQQGTRNNIFHLSNGNGDTKVELASPEHLDVLCGEVDKIVSSLRKKKIDILILGPIPRFPAHCCTDPNHGLVNSNVNTPVLTGSGIFTKIVTLIVIGETTAASASTGADEKCNKYKYRLNLTF